VSVLDDLARALQEVASEPEVLRLVLHPKNFLAVANNAAFVPAPPNGIQIPCRGHLWGVPIHVDPRNEEDIAYVVTREDKRSKGRSFKLNAPPEAPRRTAWARVMDEDPLGVD
jgi:hypothetical protein